MGGVVACFQSAGLLTYPRRDEPSQQPSSQRERSVRVTEELERLALHALADEYEQQNYCLFGDQLKAPTFQLGESTQQLGLWQSDPPTITLSRSFVFGQPWGAVAEVLKHEMAHQFVSEVLGVVEARAHGPLFSRICIERGIDPSATGTVTQQSAADASILGKVTRLLSLAQSGERHEAEAAAAAARRLMLKHNIEHASGAERRAYCFAHLGKPTGRVYESQRSLAAILRTYFFVETLWVGVYRAREGTRGSVLEVCGTRANVEMAEYVFSFLNRSAEHLWQKHRADNGITSNRDRRNFVAGVMAGFCEKLAAERTSEQQRGLIWVGDPQLGSYFKRRYPRVRTVRYGTSSDSGAHAAGRQAGGKLVLHKGMSSGPAGKTRGLLSN